MFNKKIIFAFVIIMLCASCMEGDSHPPYAITIDKMGNKNNLVSMAIIGSGPAGWSAAIYGARFKRHVVVFKGPKPGGLLTETSEVENWPGKEKIEGPDLVGAMERHARSLGVQTVQDSIKAVDFSARPFVLYTEQGETINALSVIIATGGTPVKLGVTGENAYWGHGVTSCAKCDAPFYKNEVVVVVGGGDSAVEEAIQLAPYAKKVTILVRKDRMRAAQIMQERLAQYPTISVLYNVEVTEIKGDSHQVTSVSVWNNKKRQLTDMPVSGVFLAIGHTPNTHFFNGALQLDAQGYIKLIKGRSQETSVPGVFAAGDVEDNYYCQAIVAAGSGARAAIDANAYLAQIGLNTQVENQLQSHFFVGEPQENIVTSLTSVKEFDEVVRSSNVVVVDFFAPNCPGCNELEPIFNKVARDYGHSATFVKINGQEMLDLSKRFHIYKVPCVLIFKKGNLVARYNTVKNNEELDAAVSKFVS